MKIFRFALLVASLVTITVSCSKKSATDDAESERTVCDSIAANRITGNRPLNIGDNLSLSIREQLFEDDFVYINWWGPGGFTDQGHTSIFLSNVTLASSGWYHVRLTSRNSDCEKVDSVLVTVAMPTGTPPCNLALNTISYSNIGTSPINSVMKTTSQGLRLLEAHSASGDVTIQFHPYWTNQEPVDGMYSITTMPITGQLDTHYEEVYMKAVASSILFQGNTQGQKVYISHVNGKLQAQFCNISMSGNNGMSWTTQLSGTLREQ